MKKEKRIILLFLIILSISISSFAMTGEVIVSATRIREEANTSSEIVDTIYQEDKVEIMGDNGDWYQVSFNGKDGFIKKDFLKITNEEPTKEVQNQVDTNNNTVAPQTDTVTAQNNSESSPNSNIQKEKITLTNTIELRNAPSLISQKYTTIAAGVQIEKLFEIGNWFQVTDGVHVGWVTEQRIQNSLINEQTTPTAENASEKKDVVEEKNEEKQPENSEENNENTETSLNKKGIVIVETANVREKATKDSEVIDALDEDDIVIIQAEEGDWYKVVKGSISGYVNKKLIDTNNVTSRSLTNSRVNEENSAIEVPSEDNTQAPAAANDVINAAMQSETINVTSVSGRGTEVVNLAQSFMGTRYVSAGKSPATGFDCSGFTYYIYGQFGVSLGGSAASQSSAGTPVDRSNLQPGDLLLFYDEGMTKIGHVGIYVGNGVFVHSANLKRGVVTDNLNTSSYYNARYVGARRLV
ncbi:MAG: SH3 domain-containing protein [Clostridia bacterium]|nr:SH3 domain-containing protein [Clostridia bacterium]